MASICLVFKWLGYLVFKWHSNTGLFGILLLLDHLNSELVRHSNPLNFGNALAAFITTNAFQMSHVDRRGSSSNPANGSHCKGSIGSSDPTGLESVAISALRICQDVQHMIDINSEHLERLRTPMAASSGTVGIPNTAHSKYVTIQIIDCC